MKTSCKYLAGFILIRTRSISIRMSFGICRNDVQVVKATTIDEN